jgi:ATP-binding cassette subfamily B (MDR/TAP) protein 1
MRVKEEDIDRGMRLSRDGEIVNDKEMKGVKIELQDVWFRYPTRDIPVLCGVDMTVRGITKFPMRRQC